MYKRMYLHVAEGSTAMKRTTILADEGLLLEAQPRHCAAFDLVP
jgi:hypothetical protein